MRKALFVMLAGEILGSCAFCQTSTIESVVNAFSLQPQLAPGTLAFVFGENLARETCMAEEVPWGAGTL